MHFNDVTYTIRTPKSKPIVEIVDLLQKFDGEVPSIWSAFVAKAVLGQGGNRDHQLSEITAGLSLLKGELFRLKALLTVSNIS